MPVRIALCGTVSIGEEGAPAVQPGLGRLGLVTFAYLVCERRRPVPHEELAEVLWGEDLPPTWEASLRKLVLRVRGVLAAAGLPVETLASMTGCYQLRLPADAAVDVESVGPAVERAEQALRDGSANLAREAAASAVAVASAGFLPGQAGGWVEARRAGLCELQARALEATADAWMRAGDWAQAVAAAEQAVAVEPYRESSYVRLMEAHAGGGNRAEALRAYERCRRLLADELGVRPSAGTEAVHRELLRGPSASGTGPAAQPDAPSSVLPAQLTTFVGRDAALAAVRALLAETRLLTLTGPGGIGKSRLALEVASAPAMPVAVSLAELAPVSDPRLVPNQVLSALGLRERPGSSPVDVIAGHLGDSAHVLLLDNCEHVVEAAALLTEQLLRRSTALRILATSTEPLRVPGETVWRVPPLSVPDGAAPSPQSLAGSEAVRLFVERAAATNPDFRLTAANAAAVAQVCRRLDGIPLALELAAARANALSAAEIAERLDDRFRLLTGGARTAPERHRTLRAAVEWTCENLSPEELLLFERLSTLAGTAPLEALEVVCTGGPVTVQDVAPLLAGLVDRSLVVPEGQGAATRYRMLETMREYGAERLGAEEAADLRRRHLEWTAALAERADAELPGPGQAAWLDRLEAEHDGLRAALAWGAGRGEPAALRLAAALGRFWEMRAHLTEGRMWLEIVLERCKGGPPWVRARALNGVGVLAQLQGDYVCARRMFEQSLGVWRRLGDTQAMAAAINGLASIAALQGDDARARSLYEECLAVGRAAANTQVIAAALANLGRLAHQRADFDGARSLYEESLAHRRRLGDRHGAAMVLGNLGYLAFEQGDLAAARALNAESLALRRELGDRHGIALLLGNMGRVELEEGDLAAARRLHDSGLALRRELGDRTGIPGSLNNLADLALAEGDLATARALLDESLAIATEIGDRHRVAQSLLRSARVAAAGKDLALSAELFGRTIAAAHELRAGACLAEALEGLAGIELAAGSAERAARLLGVAASLREAIKARLRPNELRAHDETAARARAELGPEAFTAAHEWGASVPLEDGVRYALALY